MLRTPSVSLQMPEPIALLDATLLFIIQLMIAQHPDVLAPPDLPEPRPPGLRAARHLIDAVRELHHALDTYRSFLPRSPGNADHATDDDIPF